MNGLVNPHRIHLVIYLKHANHNFGDLFDANGYVLHDSFITILLLY